jgi:hypothetical protein
MKRITSLHQSGRLNVEGSWVRSQAAPDHGARFIRDGAQPVTLPLHHLE